MNWLNKLEKKIGKYAIPHLIIYILGAYGIGYILELAVPEFYGMLQMNPAAIFHGQVWRLVTWITCTPSPISFFIVFMFMFYYWIGQTLESVWGAFRYNLFIILGCFMTTIAPIIMYFVMGLTINFEFANAVSNAGYLYCSTSYLNLTSFLAFALLFPDHEVYFMFILKIKMKWLAIVDGILIGYTFLENAIRAIRAFGAGQMEYSSIYASQAVIVLFSVASFIIYYFMTKNYKNSPKEIRRKRNYQKQTKEAKKAGTRHYCAICGRTEVSNPELTFRFCSKCKGGLEYCNDHLFTHEHK